MIQQEFCVGGKNSFLSSHIQNDQLTETWQDIQDICFFNLEKVIIQLSPAGDGTGAEHGNFQPHYQISSPSGMI